MEARWRCSCPCGCREGTTNLREVISTRAISKAAKNPPLPIESLHSDEPENLFDAERHCRPLGYKFWAQNFRGQKFCNAEGCFFGIFRVSLEYFFEQILFEKNYGISNFLGMHGMLLKNFLRSAISRNFRGTRKFTPDVSAEFPCTLLRHSKLKISISQFSFKIAPYFT